MTDGVQEWVNRFDKIIRPVLYFQDWDKVKEELLLRGFFKAPASTKHHGSYPGGLSEHSYNVTSALVKLTESLGLAWGRMESPYIVGLFHDLCKCDQYVYDKNTETWLYNTDTLLKGHGEKSVMIASTILKLTEEEVMCIRYHMGAFTDKEEWGDYTRAVHAYPNVLYTHTADMMAAHILELK